MCIRDRGWSGAELAANPVIELRGPLVNWPLAEQRLEALRAQIDQLENESERLGVSQGAVLRARLRPLIQELDALELAIEHQLAHAASLFAPEPPAPLTKTSFR